MGSSLYILKGEKIMNLSKIVKDVTNIVKKNSPEILTGIGVAGMVATTVMAVRATPKALKMIDDLEWEKERDLTASEKVKACWKLYLPSAITGVTSVACVIGASSVNVHRNAALATAYTLSETALKEYKDKVLETFGEKKEQTVRDAIAKDKIEKNPVTNNEVIITNKGETLCYDTFTGRYFKSDIDKLKKAENALNRQLLMDGFVSLNELYNEIGLDDTKMGEQLGWDFEKGLVELRFSSQLASDGTPCLVLDFAVAPQYTS